MSENFMRKYRQTLQLGLIKVVQELFPGERLKIPYSILDGIYCEFSGSLISQREVKLIESELKKWVEQTNEIKLIGKEGPQYRYQLDKAVISSIYPALNDTSPIRNFDIVHFPPGFILHFADAAGSGHFVLPEKLSATYTETQRWLENLNLDKIKDVNTFIQNGHSLDLIAIAEALQEKKIADIADRVLKEKKTVRMILISGPSSSGKTTFAQRLSTQLRVSGLKPVPLSLDNYFLNRDKTPRDASGQLDFDVLEALDLPYLNEQIEKLIKGETVETPVFDFLTGNRGAKGQRLCLGPDDILVVEGIHALNPRLLTAINRTYFFKIYISALFQLNIDAYNRVPTTEARLIRRIVRDDKFRGFDPERTLKQWVSVRRSESTNVFKYQEEADVMFNSSLIYELNALRSFTGPLLEKVPKQSPCYDAAARLLNLLSFFEPMDTSKVPFNSILREFIGGGLYPGV
ncbi:MAG: Uridine kinase [Candidatus Dichloromethanomonas elyunquensis]|nr:MAG: Uridine kinase [Candidatus Dichloromethanomonas elyunquensis]